MSAVTEPLMNDDEIRLVPQSPLDLPPGRAGRPD
jgi:hypothetical protein